MKEMKEFKTSVGKKRENGTKFESRFIHLLTFLRGEWMPFVQMKIKFSFMKWQKNIILIKKLNVKNKIKTFIWYYIISIQTIT